MCIVSLCVHFEFQEASGLGKLTGRPGGPSGAVLGRSIFAMRAFNRRPSCVPPGPNGAWPSGRFNALQWAALAGSDVKPGRCRAAPSGPARPGGGRGSSAGAAAPPGVSWRQGATAAMWQAQAPGFWSRLARSDGRIMIPPILEATRLARDIPGSAAQRPRVPSRTAWRT